MHCILLNIKMIMEGRYVILPHPLPRSPSPQKKSQWFNYLSSIFEQKEACKLGWCVGCIDVNVQAYSIYLLHLPPSVVNDMAGRTPSESYFHFGEIRKLVAESLFSMVINLVGVP